MWLEWRGGGVGTRPWWLALLACGGAYWPLALEPSARRPYYCGGGGGVRTRVGAGAMRQERHFRNDGATDCGHIPAFPAPKGSAARACGAPGLPLGGGRGPPGWRRRA